MIIQCPHCSKGNRVPAERLNQNPSCGACKKDLLSLPVNATAANFSELISQTALPVIVDFWAPWCGPCNMLAPVLEDVAEKFEGLVKVCKVNVDENPMSASANHVRSLPSLMLFNDGVMIDAKVGLLSFDDLCTWIEKNCKKK